MSETTQGFAAESFTATATDRRAWVRYPCDLEGACQPLMAGEDLRWSGRVVNISQGGLKIILSRRFEPQTVLQIEMQGPKARNLIVRVLYVVQEGPQCWTLGCSFAGKLSDEEVQTLL